MARRGRLTYSEFLTLDWDVFLDLVDDESDALQEEIDATKKPRKVRGW